MECVPNNWKDIDRYYRNTFVKFNEHGDRLFYISKVTPEAISGQCEDNSEFVLDLHPDHPYNLGFILPRKAVFQFKNAACLLQRIPARQYRRGICEDNVSIKVIGKESEGLTVGFKTLAAFCNKAAYPTPHQALYGKGGPKVSVALNKRLSYEKLSSRFYIDHFAVGKFDRDAHRINFNRLFRAEAEAAFLNRIPEVSIEYV